MCDAENIRAVEALGVNLIGLVFYPESPRYVAMISSGAGIMPDYSSLKEDAGPSEAVRRVGVFVDDMPQNIVTRVYNYSLDYVQLHGEESPVMIKNLRRTLDPDIRPGIQIIKALSIASAEDIQQTKEYEGLADLFLFDTRCEEKGGSGKSFEWSLLEAYEGATPFLLSGGIGPGDAARVKSFRHPLFAGIDLNSRFETEPGMKDVERLKTFIQELNR